jgi:putative transposase
MPCQKRSIVVEVKQDKPKDTSRACRILRLSRSSLHYRSKKNDITLIEKLNQLANEHPREGFWKSYYRLRNAGDKVNHKRLHRVYKQIGMPLRRKVKKRLPQRIKEPLVTPLHFTHTWSIDFVHDVLENGRKFRSFNVIDDYNREILFIETDYSIKSSRVVWVLRHLVNRFGKPEKIRMDNGPELIAKIAKEWSQMNEIEFKYIQPGKPTQNAYVERFNGSYRRGVLDVHIFETIEDVREETQKWSMDYNESRPHDALGGMPPRPYRINKMNDKELHGATAKPPLHEALFKTERK